MIRPLRQFFAGRNPIRRHGVETALIEPAVIPRSGHSVSRSAISKNALRVLYGLQKAGYEANLVGGGVRDLLAGINPKDFDIATDARPEQVRATFRNCRLIGRRFRLAHVYFGSEIIEVATYRAPHDAELDERHAATSEHGRILRDNVYGSRDGDARRRDFTINALYYDIADFSVVDYVGGFDDLRQGLIRMIGDPEARYREDPIRLLRAVRFAAKMGFSVVPATEAPIYRLGALLRDVPQARLFDETLKLYLQGHAAASHALLRKYGLLDYLLIRAANRASVDDGKIVQLGLSSTDDRVRLGKSVTPAFLYAVLLWDAFCQALKDVQAEGADEFAAQALAADRVIRQQGNLAAVPRRFTVSMVEIWALQPRFARRRGKRAMKLLGHPQFRAAYDFLLLRHRAGEEVGELAKYWTDLLSDNHGERLPYPTPLPIEARVKGRR